MKTFLAAAAALAATPLMAQTATDHSAHAGHAGHAGHGAATAATAARLNLDTPVQDIVADVNGKAVLEVNLPGVTTHEHYDMFKGMSLRAISGMAPSRLPTAMLTKLEADLAKIK